MDGWACRLPYWRFLDLCDMVRVLGVVCEGVRARVTTCMELGAGRAGGDVIEVEGLAGYA